MISRVFTLLLSTLLCAPLHAANNSQGHDWPRFMGHHANNVSQEVGWDKDWPVEGPKILWEQQVGIGLSSFAVVKNRVYTAGNNGKDQDRLYCLDLETGKVLWHYDYSSKTQSHAMPIVPFGPGATPTVVNGRVFMLGREGDLHAVNAETGEAIWHKNLIQDFKGKRPVYGYSQSPLAECGYLFLDVGGTEQSTVAIDQKDGAILWAQGSGEAGYASPVFQSLNRQTGAIIAFKGEALEIRDAMDGNLITSHATTTRDFSNTVTPLVYEDHIFISHTGSTGSTVLAYEDRQLKSKWNDRDLGMLFNSGVLWKGRLITFNDQKRGVRDLRCVDFKTGEVLWMSQEVEKGSAILSDDHLIILSNTGELLLAQPHDDSLEVLQSVQVLKGKTYALPVLSHGRILCRNNEGHIVCLDVRKPTS